MQFKALATLHAIKESKGTFEGRDFSSTTFHLDVDLKENGVGRSMGKVTRPFKFGDASEFDKWLTFSNKLPLEVEAIFTLEATKDGEKLTLGNIRPVSVQKAA